MTLVRPSPTKLSVSDREGIHETFMRAPYRHLHLDWRELVDWLVHPDLVCWVTRQDDGRVESLLGATIHAPLEVPGKAPEEKVAWLRFGFSRRTFGHDPSLDSLWSTLSADLHGTGVRQVALLSINDWILGLARRWQFAETNAVVTLQRSQGEIPAPPSGDLSIRVADDDDLTQVSEIDAEAFGPIWQYSRDTLAVAKSQAGSFTVLERAGRMIGYQLSTRYLQSAHLARLAVLPDEQGQGLGGLLIGEMLRFYEAQGISLITVNTQKDNIRSQRLYARLGFHVTHPGVAVWTREV